MASSSKLSHSASAPYTDAAALPLDALFEVLLRLPAKDLCRLRTVCRSWRALTSDPHFSAEHKSRHSEPLFAVTFADGDGWCVAIVSLSGQILKRIHIAYDRIEFLLTHLDRLCVISSLGAWVASTGDYKVLRISHGPDRQQPQLCDIITLDGSNEGTWRRKQNPPRGLEIIEIMQPLALSGIVYLLFDYAVMGPASMALFNLDTEKWMPTLQGPEPFRSADSRVSGRVLSLANLNGSLVIVDNEFGHFGVSCNLWFLMDHKRGLWVEKYRISLEQEWHYYGARPLLILDDGRIVISEMEQGLLQCYDPRTGNLADMLDMTAMGFGESQSIGVYTGSMLI